MYKSAVDFLPYMSKNLLTKKMIQIELIGEIKIMFPRTLPEVGRSDVFLLNAWH